MSKVDARLSNEGVVWAIVIVMVILAFAATWFLAWGISSCFDNTLAAIAELDAKIAKLQDAQEVHIKRCGWWEQESDDGR